MDKSKILIADDDETILKLVEQYLETKGYEVITALDGKQAIALEEKVRPDLVILDVMMPIVDGLEAFNTIRSKRSGINHIPIIFISGLSDERQAITGLQLGVDDFIRKPFEMAELSARMNNLLKMKNFIATVESMENVLFAIVKSIEARDFYTARHARRVCNISKEIGKQLKLSKKEIDILHTSALLHDVGKIGIFDYILNKPGKLTTAEFEKIKQHPMLGVEICNYLHFGPEVLDIIGHHHEKLDGGGYPDGLKGKGISKLVKIVTVADMYDAMTTKRPYRPPKTHEETIAILKKEVQDGKLDTGIVEIIEKFENI
jgi:putative two-component system response regulator